MSKRKSIFFVAVILILGIIITFFYLSKDLDGKWYLYNGNDIDTDSNINDKINLKDYIEISKETIKYYSGNGKDGVSNIKKIGVNKLHIGDAIFKYEIRKVDKYKILILKEVGYDNGHEKGIVENGVKEIYIFDEKTE